MGILEIPLKHACISTDMEKWNTLSADFFNNCYGEKKTRKKMLIVDYQGKLSTNAVSRKVM